MTLPNLGPGGQGTLSHSLLGDLTGSGEGGGSSSDMTRRQGLLNNFLHHLTPEIIGAGAYRELESLREETDPQIFDSDLFTLGQRLERRNQLEAALTIYGALSQPAAEGSSEYVLPHVEASLRNRAAENILVISGQGGSVGRRIEFQMDRFVEGATEPTMIAGMAIGASVFTASRALILPRLMNSSSRLLSTVPFATRTAASALAMVPEVGAFWGSSKGLQELLHPGSTRWDAQTNLREIASLGITLGFLKSFGFAFGRVGAWARSTPQSVAAARMQGVMPASPAFYQQMGMLTGIMAGHGTEIGIGLRNPQDPATFFVDSLIMLAQFNAGGALSQAAFPRLYAFNTRLQQRMSLQEHGQIQRLEQAQVWDQLRDLMDLGQGPGAGMGGLIPAHALPIEGRIRESFNRGPQEARDLILQMTGEGGEGEGPGKGTTRPNEGQVNEPGDRGEASEIPKINPVDPATQTEIAGISRLPERGGGEKDAFEQSGSNFNFPRDMIHRLGVRILDSRSDNKPLDAIGPQVAIEAILRALGTFQEGEFAEPPADKLGQISDSDFGFGVAHAIRTGMTEFLSPGVESYQGKRVGDFNPELQRLVRGLDELVGIERYARRSGNKEAIKSFERTLGEEGLENYESLRWGLIEVLSPQLGRAGDLFGPRDAVVSIGNGDMMSLLALFRHRIIPGQLSWRTRLFAIARKPWIAEEINATGINVKGEKALGRDRRVNFRYDPAIEVIPRPENPTSEDYQYRDPHTGRVVDPRDVLSQVQFQMLNVTSDALHNILFREYIQNLPRGAHLFEVIKGFIGNKSRGQFAVPEKNLTQEQPSLLPFELVNMALERFGREDVEVVSGGGFIPGKKLWWSKPGIEMTFAGREYPADTGRSPGADWVARAFAGRDGKTRYLEADTTHHQLSTELGGALKNVASIGGGIAAVDFARKYADQEVTDNFLSERLEFDIIRPLQDFLKDMLGLETRIKNRDNIGFRQEVEDDLRNCLGIQLRQVIDTVRVANRLAPEIYQNISNFIDWIDANIIRRRGEFAETRNPVVGIVLGLTKMLNETRGASLDYMEVVRRLKSRLTMEGVNSIPNVIWRNQHSGHPIESRRQPERVQELYTLLYGQVGLPQTLTIQPPLRRALNDQVPELDSSSIRRTLDLPHLEPEAVEMLNSEIERLDILRRQLEALPNDPRLQNAVIRQGQLLPRLLNAMENGSPGKILDFPYYFSPYYNVVRIPYTRTSRSEFDGYAFARVDGPGMLTRITQLGMFFRSLGEGTHLQMEIEATGLDNIKQAQVSYEIKHTANEILGAFMRYYNRHPNSRDRRSDIRVTINDDPLRYDRAPRQGLEREEYYQGLEPLVRRIQASPGGEGVTADTIRRARGRHARVLDEFITRETGWPMLLNYFGGPIQRGLKAGFSRPESQTMVGIYSGGRLVETFMVYRDRHNKPRALNYSVLREFEEGLGKTEPEVFDQYVDLRSIDYFEGVPLGEFLEHYEYLGEQQGRTNLTYRIIDLQSLPLERALAGRFAEVNPAALRIFLQFEGNTPEAQAMLAELNRLYECSLREGRSQATEIISRYLNAFKPRLLERFEDQPLIGQFRPFYDAFEENRTDTFRKLISRSRSLESEPPPDPSSASGSGD